MTVIVLLADGARADAFRAALDSGALPAMARLRSEGGLHDVTSTFPSVTGPAYAPFLMGRFPGPVGMPGLRWYDRARDATSFPDYSRSYMGYQMAAVDRDLDPNAPTVFELVHDSAGAMSMITRGLPPSANLASLTVRSALRAAWTHFRGDIAGWLEVDREVSRRVLERVHAGGVRYLFAAFTGVDKLSHAEGHDSPGVLRALRIVDDTVGALREELERRGAAARTRIWICSDHGHSPVREHEDLERLIAGWGHRVMAHPWVYRWSPSVAVMVSGNAMAHLYVDLYRRDRPFWGALEPGWRELSRQLLELESVDLLLLPVSETECAVWSRAHGRARVLHDQRGYSYCTSEGDPLGVGVNLHGVCAADAHEATLHSDYPDSIVQIAKLAASRRSGDLILSAARNWDFRARYEPIPHVSSHGALHREHMSVPLLLDRPASRSPRRTADVMPSTLASLGVPVPDGLDGESFI